MRLYLWFLLAYSLLALMSTTLVNGILPQKNIYHFNIVIYTKLLIVISLYLVLNRLLAINGHEVKQSCPPSGDKSGIFSWYRNWALISPGKYRKNVRLQLWRLCQFRPKVHSTPERCRIMPAFSLKITRKKGFVHRLKGETFPFLKIFVTLIPIIPALGLFSLPDSSGMFPTDVIPTAFMFLLPGAFLEEFLFRGPLFMQWVYLEINSIFPVLLSSILFAMAHISIVTSVTGFVTIFSAGCVFALVRKYLSGTNFTRRISFIAIVFGHFLWNYISLLKGHGISDIPSHVFGFSNYSEPPMENFAMASVFWMSLLVILARLNLTGR